MTPPQQGSGRELRHGTWCPSLLCLEVADVEILLLMEPISTATTGLQVLVFPSEPLEFLQSPAYYTAWLDSVTRPPLRPPFLTGLPYERKLLISKCLHLTSFLKDC